MTGLPDLVSILRRRFVPKPKTRGDSDAAAAIQLLRGHPAEMRDLDGSRRHCRMAQARLARRATQRINMQTGRCSHCQRRASSWSRRARSRRYARAWALRCHRRERCRSAWSAVPDTCPGQVHRTVQRQVRRRPACSLPGDRPARQERPVQVIMQPPRWALGLRILRRARDYLRGQGAADPWHSAVSSAPRHRPIAPWHRRP
jgi:hypothetical protein